MYATASCPIASTTEPVVKLLGFANMIVEKWWLVVVLICFPFMSEVENFLIGLFGVWFHFAFCEVADHILCSFRLWLLIFTYR